MHNITGIGCAYCHGHQFLASLLDIPDGEEQGQYIVLECGDKECSSHEEDAVLVFELVETKLQCQMNPIVQN